MIPDIEGLRLIPHMTDIMEFLKMPNFLHDPFALGVAQKWHFSTSGDAASIGRVSGDHLSNVEVEFLCWELLPFLCSN